MRSISLAAACAAICLRAFAAAQETPDDGTFDLGRIVVRADTTDDETPTIGSETLPHVDSELYLSLSSRARFPTIFERFSSQFGTAEPNPELQPERATNLELGGSHQFGAIRASGALFYSWLTDALVSVRTAADLNRRENYGSANYYGFEASLDAALSLTIKAGANLSMIHRSFDVGTPPAGALIRPFELTDVPGTKAFACCRGNRSGRSRSCRAWSSPRTARRSPRRPPTASRRSTTAPASTCRRTFG